MCTRLASEIPFAPIHLVVLALAFSSLLLGQETAELGGTVTDAIQKAAISGATVTVTRTDTGAEKKTFTNGQGIYIVSGLQPGAYEIELRKEGFQTVVRGDVKLQAGDKMQLDFEMSLGATAQAVTVTVSAQKKDERLLDVPVPVSAISATKLTDNNQVLLSDYASSVPGLHTQADIVNQQQVSIRGITTGGSGAAVVGIMVDGIPVGGSYNETGEAFAPDFDPGDLERVEVLRGPQGTLYGASSMGGLVNYITVEPSTDRFTGRIQAGYGSIYNGAEPGFNVRASVNIPIADKLAIRLSGFVRQDPGYIDNPTLGLKGVNKAQADGARLAALWTPTDKISLKVSALYQYYKQDAASDVVVAPGLGPWRQNYIADYGGANRKSAQVYSTVLNADLGFAKLTSSTGYNINHSYSTLDFSYVFANGVQNMFGVAGAPYLEHDNPQRFTEEVRLAGAVWRVDWTTGGYYSHERSQFSDSVYASDPVTGKIVGLYFPFENPSLRVGKEYAGFANLDVHVTEKFDVQVGGRESHVSLYIPEYSVTGGIYGSIQFGNPTSYSSDSVFTYSVTPKYKISSDFMVYAKASSGFRPGTHNSVITGAGVSIPPAAKADQTKNYEVGVKGTFLDEKLTLDASVYYIDWKNLQLNLKSPLGFNYYANGSAAKSEGTELTATVRPFNGLTIEGWIDYDNAVLTQPLPAASTAVGNKGDRLPITPRWSGYLSATKEFPLWSHVIGFVGGDVNFVGDRLGNFSGGARTPYPGYTKVDLRTGVKVNAWEVNLYLNNVGNERGLLGGGVGYDPPNAFVYIRPRMIGLNLSKSF